MSSNQHYDGGEEEAAEAQDRINRILNGQGGEGGEQPSTYNEDPLGGGPRVQLRSRAARAALGVDDDIPMGQLGKQARSRERQPASSARQAILILGGIVGLGVVVVVALVLLSAATKPGAGISLPFFATATPTATNTPLPTPTATATATVPPLQLPNLTCLVQTSTGCLDYCQNIDNLKECDQARAQVETQGADFTVFLKCVAPGPGPNVGSPQKCMEDAYRAKHP